AHSARNIGDCSHGIDHVVHLGGCRLIGQRLALLATALGRFKKSVKIAADRLLVGDLVSRSGPSVEPPSLVVQRAQPVPGVVPIEEEPRRRQRIGWIENQWLAQRCHHHAAPRAFWALCSSLKSLKAAPGRMISIARPSAWWALAPRSAASAPGTPLSAKMMSR